MASDKRPHPAHSAGQRAALSLRIGRRARARLSVEMTAEGIAAVGMLVSGILLSTAVLVRSARRDAGPRGTAAAPRRLAPPHCGDGEA